MKKAQLVSAYLGNLFEHYDTALFGFLSPFLAPLIFPKQDPLTALILTYAMIPLGMLARPIGSLFFGMIGDIYGRKVALFWTLLGMGIVSLCIAMTPLYAQLGLLSPLIFCIGRVAQNFLAAGEVMGGAIFLLENSSEKRHDLLSSLYNASTIGGILFASFGVMLMGFWDIEWRLLYVAGSITALFACFIRGRSNIEHAQTPRIKNLRKVFWEHRKPLLLIIFVSGFSYCCYSLSLVLMNGLIPMISNFTKEEMIRLNTFLLIFDFCALPLFGYLATKISRERIMLIAALSAVFLLIPCVLLLRNGNFMVLVVVRMCLVLMGVAFSAPFHAWAQSLIAPSYRYVIVAFGYAIGSQLLGGPNAAISLWLFQKTGSLSSVCWYASIMALTATFAVVTSSKIKINLTAEMRLR